MEDLSSGEINSVDRNQVESSKVANQSSDSGLEGNDMLIEESSRNVPMNVFDGSEFAIWKKNIIFVLKTNDLYRVVVGDEVPLAIATSEERKIWHWKDDKALSLIGLCLNEEILMEAECDSSSALWNWLIDRYEKKSEIQILDLHHVLESLRYNEGDDLRKHFTLMKDIYDQLAAMGEQYRVNEEQQKLKLYQSLPESWHSSKSSLLMNELVSWEEATTAMLEEQTMEGDFESSHGQETRESMVEEQTMKADVFIMRK